MQCSYQFAVPNFMFLFIFIFYPPHVQAQPSGPDMNNTRHKPILLLQLSMTKDSLYPFSHLHIEYSKYLQNQ